MSRYLSKSARKFKVEEEAAPNLCWYQKTRVFLLPQSEDRMILSSFIWVQYQRVTDGLTNGIAVANTALCIASNAALAMRPRCKNITGT